MAITEDTERKTEYSDVSVDDILAEFDITPNGRPAEAGSKPLAGEFTAPASYNEYEEELKVYTPRAQEADVKLYEPKSKLSQMADGARDYVLGRIQDDFSPVEEPPAEASAEDYETDSYPGEEYTQENYSYDDYAEGYSDYADQYEQSPEEFQSQDYYEDEQEYYPGTQDFEAQGGYYEGEEIPQDFEQSGDYDEAPAAEEEYIDPRFNLGGRPREELSYGGEALDISPDENYEGNQQTEYIPVTKMAADIPDMPEGYIPDEEESPDEENPEFKGSIFKKPKKHKEKKEKKPRKSKKKEESFPEAEAPEDSGSSYSDSGSYNYAPKADYAAAAAKLPPGDDFPSFKEYLLGLLTGILYRMRNPGAAEADGTTMPDSDEDLGRELNPKAASGYYGSFLHSMKLRTGLSLILVLILAYVSLGLPLPGMLKTVKVQAAFCLSLQLGVSILCLDVFTGGVMNLMRRRFGADIMAVIFCLVTAFDALGVVFGAFGDTHLPLCLLSSLSLTGLLISALFHARGMRKALRVPSIAKTFYAVSSEANVKGSGRTLVKTPRGCGGFLHRSEEASPDETLFNRISPFILAGCILLALIVCAVKKCFGDFLFVLSAFLAPAVPFTALLCFALPFFVGSARIFRSGAAIAGWSGLCDIGSSRNLIVTDRDLFPQGSVKIDNIRIFSDVPSEKIISYAGTMLSASGMGIASCFGELMEKNNCGPKHLENFEYLAGGGLRGIIDGETVLCGGLEFMRLMNVHVPYKLIQKCSVLLAVDNVLYGIFNLNYKAEDNVRKALVGLMKSNRHPIFAIRDFNITPEMIKESFDVPTAGYDFPPFAERFEISEAKADKGSKIAALVCREGLGPLTHMADTGRSMFNATRLNILLTLISAALGVLIVLVKFLIPGFVSPGFLLGYALIWALLIAIISTFLKF